jgi:hypothetical protein
MPVPARTAGYAVHWMLSGLAHPAEAYAHSIIQSWRRCRVGPGSKRVHCDHLASVVVVMVELVADDLVHAVDSTRGLVVVPLESAGLTLPESVVVVASAVNRDIAA